jgi:hypothetical protein
MNPGGFTLPGVSIGDLIREANEQVKTNTDGK